MNKPDHISEEFRTLFDKAPLAYQSLDENGFILLVNQQWLELLGYEREAVTGRHIAEFMTETCQEHLKARFSAFKETGATQGNEFDFIHSDGTIVPVRVSGRIDRNTDGSGLHTHCILSDLREERASAAALVANEKKYRGLVEMAQEGIWQIAADGTTTFVNPAMARMLGYRHDEMLGRHIAEFMEPVTCALFESHMQYHDLADCDLHKCELLAIDGRLVVVNMATSTLSDDFGNPTGILAGVIDMTEHHLLEEQMHHTQKLESLGVLAGGIAHDFNNLLQTILGNVDIAQLDVADGTPHSHCLSEIETAGKMAAELCQQMLAYAGKSKTCPVSLDLNEAVKEMGPILRASISKKAVLNWNIAPDLPNILADAAQIHQVIMNLVINGSEALDGAPGLLEMNLEAQDIDGRSYVQLTMSDNGIGMTDEVRARIFDPFYTTKFTGRGLGLAAVQGIIKSHDGAIDVESAPGAGTTIRVLLPVGPLEKTNAQAAESAAGGRLPRHLILLADDDEMVLGLGTRMLEKLGQSVLTAVNGREAVDLFLKHRADLSAVILDLTMPVMDGYEAFQIIREHDASIPILISSGYTEESITSEFGGVRPSAFLLKPYRIQQLQAGLAALLEVTV